MANPIRERIDRLFSYGSLSLGVPPLSYEVQKSIGIQDRNPLERGSVRRWSPEMMKSARPSAFRGLRGDSFDKQLSRLMLPDGEIGGVRTKWAGATSGRRPRR